MANEEQLKILRHGVEAWNEWREKNSNESIDLSDANLKGVDLSEANLSDANLKGADLRGAFLAMANFSKASLKMKVIAPAEAKVEEIRKPGR